MEKIQVLALNDDNHATMFALRGKCFEDAISFMNNCLTKPHSNEFEIRGIYICDENVNIDAFELVETDPKYLNEEQFNKRQRAFSALWEVADKECRYV